MVNLPSLLAESWDMAEPQFEIISQEDEQQLASIMSQLDVQSPTREAQWLEKRTAARKSVRVNCEVRFIGPDTEAVLWVGALSRELSASGMSFVSRQHFRRQVPILITLCLAEGNNRRLPAVVVHSSQVSEGWFLTGVCFRKSTDTRLLPEFYDQTQATDAFEGNRQGDEEEEGVPTRERMLRMLERIRGRRTKTNLTKTVSASMSPDPVVRRACIPVLMDLAGQEANRALMRLLSDNNPQIQGEAAEALGSMGTKQAIEPLKVLLQHLEDEVAVRAAEALGKLGDPSGRRVAARVVRTENPTAVRAAKTLGIIVGRTFRPTLEGLGEARAFLDAEGD
jgi:hypothetical protein